jgi:hypothetical protein
MDLNSDWRSSLTCVCSRSFAQPGGLAYHQRSCKKTKVRLAGALATAKDAWAERKRRRLEVAEQKKLSQPDADERVREAHEVSATSVAVHIFFRNFFGGLL